MCIFRSPGDTSTKTVGIEKKDLKNNQKKITHDIEFALKRMNKHITPLKTNMSPENQWLEDVFPTEIVHF